MNKSRRTLIMHYKRSFLKFSLLELHTCENKIRKAGQKLVDTGFIQYTSQKEKRRLGIYNITVAGNVSLPPTGTFHTNDNNSIYIIYNNINNIDKYIRETFETFHQRYPGTKRKVYTEIKRNYIASHYTIRKAARSFKGSSKNRHGGSARIRRHPTEFQNYFYQTNHQDIFRAITNLGSRSQPVDMLTVTEELKRMKKPDACGGPFYISQITSMVASTALTTSGTGEGEVLQGPTAEKNNGPYRTDTYPPGNRRTNHRQTTRKCPQHPPPLQTRRTIQKHRVPVT